MGQRGGGTAQKGKRNSIQENDIFFNKPVSEFMVNYLKPHLPNNLKKTKILDACANDGVLGYTLMESIGDSRLTMQDIKKSGQSITSYYPESGNKYDVIVCNPPWVPVTLTEEIYHHLYNNLLDDHGVMFFIINNTFVYQSIGRGSELTFQKYYFLPRYVFRSVGRPLLDCGVMVCHKDKKMNKKALELDCFIPIPRELCKIEYKPEKEWKEKEIEKIIKIYN